MEDNLEKVAQFFVLNYNNLMICYCIGLMLSERHRNTSCYQRSTQE